MTLDARLRSLYQGLDASSGFDEGVMARVRAESKTLAAEKAERARVELRRYELARGRQSWGTWVRRAVTPDRLGAAAFAGFVIHSVWTGIQAQAGPLASVYAALAVTVLGIAPALAAPALLLQRHRRMSRLT